MPKGVMWRQDDIFSLLNSAGIGGYPPDGASRGFGPAADGRPGHERPSPPAR
jgi:hypothetical protein